MKKLYIQTTILIMAGLLFAGQGFAAITADQAARLGKDLTPMGGEKAGLSERHAPSRPLGRRQSAFHHHG